MTGNIIGLAIIDDEDDLPEGDGPPSYSTPGRILVHYMGPAEGIHNRYECEVLDHDSNTAVFWICEGTGINYWLDEHAEFTEPGHYVIEGITGEYIKGEWGHTDDDEEWTFTSMRPATEEEIRTGALS